MVGKDTLPEWLKPLMSAPSIKLDHCAICGRAYPLNQHHMVRRSAGKLFKGGREVKKPTITLCGAGNIERDADGIPYCHGMAHAGKLHFRWVSHEMQATKWGDQLGGHLEYLQTEEAVNDFDALSLEGWRELPSFF